MNLNSNQWLCIVIAVLGVCAASTAQLNDLFGPKAAHTIVSTSTLLMSILSSIVAILTGQGGQIRAVQAMPGVEKITVNARADATLATLAVDPAQAKIEATPEATAAVIKTAKEAA